MAAGAQLEQPLIQPASPEVSKGAWLPSPLTVVSYAFLAFVSAAMALSSWSRGLGAVFFVAFSYLDLVMLFYCLRMYRREPPGSPRWEHLRVAMLLLTTMLTISFLQLLEFWFTCMARTKVSVMDFLYPSKVP